MRARPGALRLALIASGDFACNLYWQSLTLFLFFFYTDVLEMPPAQAGIIYFVGSVWAGIADLLAGIHAQRSPHGYRWFLNVGAIPLGLSFVLLYVAPPLAGAALVAFALVAHLLFRTLYAWVNVPFAALSVRVSDDSRDRALIAGLRMLFGSAAAVLVALGTRPIGEWIGISASQVFTAAAVTFALLGTVILSVAAGAAPRDPVTGPEDTPSVAACLRVLARNRAFVSLNLASMATGIAGTVIGQSVLYYFTYVVGDAPAGPATLAMMAVSGTAAVPLWMALGHRMEARGVWLVAAALGLLLLGGLALGGPAQVLLVAIQVPLVGFSFAYWAMLPDTVEYGEHVHGMRVEAIAFGLSALVHKATLGLAVGVIGLGYQAIGYVAGGRQTAGTLAGIQWIMTVAPAATILLSLLAMLANPLRRGTHARLVAELAEQRRA